MAPAEPDAGEFTILYFGDSHIDTAVQTDEIVTMCDYIADHAGDLSIEMVLFGGDITDSIDGHPVELAAFVTALGALVDVPHLLAIGNHDYDSPGVARDRTVFNANFPQAYYTGMAWWSGGFYDGFADNAYLLRTIEGVDYIFIALEFFPRQGVIDWADALLTTYAARRAIIVTHAYEYSDNTPYSVGDPFGPDVYPECGVDYHWGDEVWTELLLSLIHI